MKKNDLSGKTIAELKDEETRLRKELFDLRFQHGTRRLMDTASMKRMRKDIARVLTAQSMQMRQQSASK